MQSPGQMGIKGPALPPQALDGGCGQCCCYVSRSPNILVGQSIVWERPRHQGTPVISQPPQESPNPPVPVLGACSSGA